ncbi:MAG: hypothetical protein QOD76_487 [Solirubrobacteraceae bacterium]|nr:hypothetical protein [Solirubrobacteraceae bacterium]
MEGFLNLDAYRAEAETFVGEISLEYYRHFAGLKADLEIEAIYDRHAALFTRAAVDDLRALGQAAAAGDEARRLRALLDFCVEGHLGEATKSADAELARREAELRIDVDGESIGFRESDVVQANEPDGERRAHIEAARLRATEAELNPLRREAIERTQALAVELGWSSYREMCEQLKGIDLAALERQTDAFTAATEDLYAEVLDPELRRTVGVGLAELRRSDLPWFFRAIDADEQFPAQRLVASFTETLSGLGIDPGAQHNVVLDVDPRPNKSPRAFCAPVRVPEEIYLVVPPVGGRDDYFALFHEGGHAQHYAWVDAAMPFEFRCLGDNSVTEGFAFLFDHLIEDPEWLLRRLGVHDDGSLAAHVRAQRLVFLRRYAAKLSYELELHSNGRPLDNLAGVYAQRLSAAVGVDWPPATFLTDVDPGFYSANYLRAWSLETHLRQILRERFGPAWFEQPEAGSFLRSLWREGQRLSADELLREVAGEDARLDFSAMLEDLELER